MDDLYRGSMGAQSLAGSVSGQGSKATVSGAVSVLYSNTETLATIAKNSTVKASEDVKLSAIDKTKLAVRAGALSISKGTSIGVGASFAIIYADSVVKSTVEDGTKELSGRNITVEAIKKRVDISDYKSSLNTQYLMTDSSDVPEGQAYEPGILDYKKKYRLSLSIGYRTIE